MTITAAYFDGETSRHCVVEVAHRNGMIELSGDMRRAFALREVRVLERATSRTRKVAFPDGAVLEVFDSPKFEAILTKMGYRDPAAIKMHHSWKLSLAAIVTLAFVMIPGYLYGLPAAANAVARRMPEGTQYSVGKRALDFLDKRAFSPSELPVERQLAIVNRFQSLKHPRQDVPKYEILFRKSRIGPNAFALPSGDIVMTDELVGLLGDDDAVMGVLAHELGHLQERHMLRRVIQGSVVGLVTLVLFGDASSVVSAAPTAMLDMKYSRDAEREADDYAIAMMQANDISLDGLKLTFDKLGKKSPQMSSYLSTHPATAERLERIALAESKSPKKASSVRTEVTTTAASAVAAAPPIAAASSNDAVAATPPAPAPALANPVVNTAPIFGEWKPDVEEWLKAGRQKGVKPDEEGRLRQQLSKSSLTFKSANAVHFNFSDRPNGDFPYQAKSENNGCFDLSIAQLGDYWACVSGSVMVLQNQKTGEAEHYVRR